MTAEEYSAIPIGQRLLWSVEETDAYLRSQGAAGFAESFEHRYQERKAEEAREMRVVVAEAERRKRNTGRYLTPQEATRFPEYDAGHRRICKMCGALVSKPLLRYCSTDCRTEYQVLTGWQLRDLVYARDAGVCALCGVDTKEYWKWDEASRNDPVWQLWQGSLWQADHIIPVFRGGGKCGLKNIRTLCSCCHLAETYRELYG